ncbi:DNA-binding protein [Bacillus smithii]|uniref:DNA-binding protein n=1 Tax=Bacillus smithii TaxID=1479 RepID=UPI003D1D5648
MKFQFDSREEVEDFIRNEVLTTSEVKEILNVTKQRLHALVSSSRITPIKKTKNDSLFFREDVMKLKPELEELRKKYRPYEG